MTEDEEIAEFFRQAVVIQSMVHTGRHPDCPREDGQCDFPECDCMMSPAHRNTPTTPTTNQGEL